MGKPIELQKICNHLERAENVLFLHIKGGKKKVLFFGLKCDTTFLAFILSFRGRISYFKTVLESILGPL